MQLYLNFPQIPLPLDDVWERLSADDQAAALEALTEQRQSFRPMRDIYQRRRDLSAEILQQAPALQVLSPDAGMYLLVDVSSVYSSTRQFVRDLFDATGVSVIDASAFGASCAGWIRLSFTISDEELSEGCRRLVSFVNARVQN